MGSPTRRRPTTRVYPTILCGPTATTAPEPIPPARLNRDASGSSRIGPAPPFAARRRRAGSIASWRR
jgi:hypothetical protein